ncbi:hypothetical protein GGI14_006053 [Coemansia sp. S680]|nr:hypothetical protein GGI14_006053 [Coemansia sp. S680]
MPFPNLCRLISPGDYSFGDDPILLRDNAATLEYLQLDLTLKLTVVLTQQNIFTPTSHPRLQCIMLNMPLGMSLLNKADYSDLIRLMLGIGPEAAIRKISSWSFSRAPLPVLTLLGKHNRLQVLALSEVRMSLWEAMTLIQSLPLLSDFHAKAPTLDPLPDGITKRRLISYVNSNYFADGYAVPVLAFWGKKTRST